MLAHGSNPSANASESGPEKQSAAAEAATPSSWSTGAPVPMSFFVLVRHRRRRLLLPAPPSAPGATPSELGEPPCGVCWEAGWPSRADCRGRLAPFAAITAALGRVHSLARWWRLWQRRQRCGNWQVATRCE